MDHCMNVINSALFRRIGAALLIAVLLLSASGCGSQSSTPGETERTVSAGEESVQTSDSVPSQSSEDASESVSAENESEYYSRVLAQKSQDFSPEDAEIQILSENLPAAEKDYTVMIYMIGSNLESRLGNATKDMEEMEKAGLDYGKTNLILYTGGSRRWVGDVPADRNCVIDASLPEEERIVARTEKNASMGAAETLANFVTFCTENYPAEHYALIMWDHGGGSLFGYGSDELFDNDSLLLPELDTAMSSTVFAGDGQKLDFVGFDACLMATLENMEIWKDYAYYMIASEELEPGDGWDYTCLKAFNESTDSKTVAGSILDCFEAYYGDNNSIYKPDITLSFVDLSKISRVSEALDDLAGELSDTLDLGGFSDIMKKRAESKSFGMAENTKGSVSYYYDLVDMMSLAMALSDEYRESAGILMDSISDAVISTASNVSDANGISLYFPYRNKGQFEVFYDTYRMVGNSEKYLEFLQKNAEEWMSGRVRDWKIGTPLSTGDEYQIQLTEDQIDNMAGAYYSIYLQHGLSGYKPLLQKVRIEPDEDGMIHLPKDLQLMVLYTDEYNHQIWPVKEIESDEDRSVFRTVNSRLCSSTENLMIVGDLVSQEVEITLSVDKKDGTVSLMNVVTAASASDLSGKNTVDIDSWEGIYHNYRLYSPTKDADGSVRPFSEWTDQDWALLSDTVVEDDFGFMLMNTSDFADNLYCQIEIEDTNGEFYGSDIAELKHNDSCHESVMNTSEGTLTFNVYSDHASVSGYNGTDTELVVPDKVEGKPVTEIFSYVFGKALLFDSNGTYKFTRITLPDSIETIYSGAFYACNKLEHINIPKSVKYIGPDAFFCCSELKELDLPEGLEFIGKGAFSYCSSVENITIPSSVTHMGEGALMCCRSLKSLSVASENTVYKMEGNGLYSMDGRTLLAWTQLSGGRAEIAPGTERIAYGAFSSSGISEAVLPDGLSEIDNYAFFDCKDMAIPAFPDSVETLGMFSFDVSYWSYDADEIPPHETVYLGKGIKKIGEHSFDSRIYRDFSVPDENIYFSVKEGSLMNKAGDALIEGYYNDRHQFVVPEGTLEFRFTMLDFLNNIGPSLLNDVIHIYIPASVERMPESDYTYGVSDFVIHCVADSAAEKYAIEYGFDYSHEMEPFYETATVSSAGGVYTFRVFSDYALLENYTGEDEVMDIPSVCEGRPVKVIGTGEKPVSQNSFSFNDSETHNDSPNVTRVIIPEGVEEISNKALNDFGWFGSVEISLPSTLKIIGNEALRVSGTLIMPEGVEMIGDKFCTGKLESTFTLTSALKYISPKAFYGVTGITEFVQEGSNDIYSVKDGMLLSGDGKTLLSYPSGGEAECVIPDYIEAIGECAFYENTNLVSVSFPAEIKYIGKDAFHGCGKLETVSFSEAGEEITVDENAFAYCSVLEEVDLAGVEDLRYSAFRGCEVLRKAVFHETLKSIGENAFSYTILSDISLPESLRIIADGAFGDYYTDSRDGCPDVIHIGKDVVSIGDYAFAGLFNKNFEVAADNTKYSSKDGLLYNKGGDTLLACPSGRTGEVHIPEGTISVEDYCFIATVNVTDVYFPDSVIAIGSVNFDRYDDELNITIHASEGSFAQKYAQENGIGFKTVK